MNIKKLKQIAEELKLGVISKTDAGLAVIEAIKDTESFQEEVLELERAITSVVNKFRKNHPKCILKVEHSEIKRHNFGGKPDIADVIKVSANPSQFFESKS